MESDEHGGHDPQIHAPPILALLAWLKKFDDDHVWVIQMAEGSMGADDEVWISKHDITKFCNMQEISSQCVLFYIR